ncbi:MAG: hypothetical protein ACRBG0_05790 [Lewinella sp.]|uniref:hypothetical protein n=1 Tax=Lewinella sp. TaxID=2004506 RepID=UPI003D6B8D21
MRTLKIYLTSTLFLIGLMITFLSCEKDPFLDEEVKKPDYIFSEPIVFNVDDLARSSFVEQTILGEVRQNPYTVENLAAAMNEVYGTSIEKVPTTHHYLKFEPQNETELVALEETELIFFDFPLEQKVERIGDYYFEPGSKGDYPTLWTVVSPEDELPAVNYELIAELNLIEADPFLMRRAFTRTGNTEEVEERYPLPLGLTIEDLQAAAFGNGGTTENSDDCHPGCASWPCCISDQLNCGDDFIPEWCRNFEPECYPGHPDYPNCAEDDGGNGSTLLTNDCGCLLSSNRRYPGGCVRVEDTQLGYEGVRNVQVIGWNGWFTIDNTYTDDNGCWRINRAYKGNAYFMIKFKNGRGTRIRGPRAGARLWEHLTTVTDNLGQVAGPNFHNMTVNYNMWNNQNSQAHRYWGAASINNLFHAYNDYADENGISRLPDLDIYVAPQRRGGFALMTSYLGAAGLANVVTDGLYQSDHFGNWELLDMLYATAGGITAASVANFVPDVMIGTNHSFSDRLADIGFHELGHAGIYHNVGSAYWQDLATAEIVADNETGHPWGNASVMGAGHISIMESWAEHVSHHFTHAQYGSNTSDFDVTYIRRLEQTRNFTDGHIPIGIYQDLYDGGEELVSQDRIGPWVGTVNDQVRDISIQQIFNLITSQVTNPDELRIRINSDIVPGTNNTTTDINRLFNSYE